jgi:hypothetical protein
VLHYMNLDSRVKRKNGIKLKCLLGGFHGRKDEFPKSTERYICMFDSINLASAAGVTQPGIQGANHEKIG